jgi:hypothetical protein
VASSAVPEGAVPVQARVSAEPLPKEGTRWTPRRLPAWPEGSAGALCWLLPFPPPKGWRWKLPRQPVSGPPKKASDGLRGDPPFALRGGHSTYTVAIRPEHSEECPRRTRWRPVGVTPERVSPADTVATHCLRSEEHGQPTLALRPRSSEEGLAGHQACRIWLPASESPRPARPCGKPPGASCEPSTLGRGHLRSRLSEEKRPGAHPQVERPAARDRTGS